ncbi:MAG: quinolinate synthase NadA, partial [candidate division KSB1 bacterium]|nr:quinolinate synthase NadA [candidate division KSB1 bacterium]
QVIELADFRGDSYGLCQQAANQREAEFIIFCGVHFMAEAADIISHPHQIVQLPDMMAGCPLAAYATLADVTQAWNDIRSVIGAATPIIPITYINSSAEIKAFCGQHGGTVCTSSNAVSAFRWAFQHAEKLFFFPDQHLGTNTANKLGIPASERIVWDPTRPMGGHSPEAIQQSRVILWQGHCHVHTWFQLAHLQQVRGSVPGARIIVHPECTEEVVNAADANGSTTYIIKFVQESPADTAIAVGTELNLVNRLARENPDKRVFPLARSLCPNMYRINLYNLCWTLENLGTVNVVKVDDSIKADALLALNQMLSLT